MSDISDTFHSYEQNRTSQIINLLRHLSCRNIWVLISVPKSVPKLIPNICETNSKMSCSKTMVTRNPDSIFIPYLIEEKALTLYSKPPQTVRKLNWIWIYLVGSMEEFCPPTADSE